jgi:uncharacterized protein HemX
VAVESSKQESFAATKKSSSSAGPIIGVAAAIGAVAAVAGVAAVTFKRRQQPTASNEEASPVTVYEGSVLTPM